MVEPSELPPLSETQWEIMNVIWQHSRCSVKDVWTELTERREIARNTVQTQMVRLEEKGWLGHDETNQGFMYWPTVSQSRSQQSSVDRLVETVFDGSLEGLMLTLVDSSKLSKGEAQRIKRLISQARRKKS